MLSDMGELQVSVRYPSMQSLRTQFNEADYGKLDKERIPSLDEKYVMESGFTGTEEDQTGESTLFIDDETDLVSKKGSCWCHLKFSGMIQWGKRRPVRFLGQHEKNNLESFLGSVKDTGLDVKEQNERGEMTDRKRKKCEEKELTKEVSNEIRTTRKSKRNKKLMKAQHHGLQNELVLYSKKKRKVTIDRWSAERYKSAEESMLNAMKAKGAVFEKPILRPALRSEARKLIGDTGLLDHLLKHMAGKVAPGGTERFRRRHNAEGAMEYWLESADLVKIRQEAGVQDPYWTPPPGWKPGDNPSQDPVCARELRDIKEEMYKIKQEMQQLASKKREEQLAIVTTTNSCLSDNFNLEGGDSLATMQEIYIKLMSKKSKIEEQLKDISIALTDMEEQMMMMMLKSREEATSVSAMPPALLAAATGGVPVAEIKEEEGRNMNSGGKAARGEEERSDCEDRAARIERLKSGFRICQPNVTTMSPPDVVPTPSSASSCSSLVKPLAERRPISPATLTHVTMPFTPSLSPPPSQKAPFINLNEAPPNYDPSSCPTLPY